MVLWVDLDGGDVNATDSRTSYAHASSGSVPSMSAAPDVVPGGGNTVVGVGTDAVAVVGWVDNLALETGAAVAVDAALAARGGISLTETGS